MVHSKHMLFITAAFLIFWGGGVEASESFAKCLSGKATTCTLFFSRSGDTRIREVPNEFAPTRWRATAGMALRVNWKKTRLSRKRNWAYVDNGVPSEAGWIHANDIAGYGDFRKVIRCWPVRAISDNDDRLGDFVLAAEFSEDGSGRLTSEGGKRVNIWFTPGLILIGKEANADGYVYGFDRKTNTIWHPTHAYKLQHVTLGIDHASCHTGFATK